ncbi:MAG: DUF1848 domain-containing protein [Oscillospiraceae bacterium]|nr:DUF1848 domain-containing protein [Oscillospiraceae bacterium]
MIISASRRTDIPACYADWLVNRLHAGYCMMKNPYNPAQVKRVSLLPEDVAGIVLWTKNAAPLLPKLAALEPYKHYFQYTITPYYADIENGLADKKSVIAAFIELSRHTRVIWRYDPIIITPKYTHEYHVRAFTKLCELLAGHTEKCIISFAIAYKSVAKNLAAVGHVGLPAEEKLRLAADLRHIASEHGITLCSCCEELGLQSISCIDASLFNTIAPRDKHQRVGCNCAISVDIGAYNSCMNGCLYCYANHSLAKVCANFAGHNAQAELLID